MTEPRLRPVTGDDREFLVDLYAACASRELAHVPWDAAARRAFIEHQFEAQDAHYREHYPGASLDVIEFDGEPAGRLYVHRGPREIRIMDIAPPFRGRGIGTGLLRGLMAEAEQTARKLSIHVEMSNPARTLYERRLRSGEHRVYVLMERPPT